MENTNLPQHIAIIMDGNRRWARGKNMPIKYGHKKGAENLETITKYANKIGIKYLTVYAFSTENWNRSKEEVTTLMAILKTYIEEFGKRADLENIKINVIGDITRLAPKLQKSIENCMNRTADNTGLVLNIAFNYGGRDEIVKAAKKIAEKAQKGEISIENIDEKMFADNLYTAGMPDPDLLIRTSGEMRTSGFLLWQLSYTEFMFVQKYWPEFSEKDLDDAIMEFQKRNRRFGGK